MSVIIKSAAVAAAAALGTSVLVQVRRLRNESEWRAREAQWRLFEVALGDEELRGVIGEYSRTALFANAWVMHQRARVLTGEGGLDEVAKVAGAMFGTEAGREYWRAARAHFVEHFRSDLDREFIGVLDEAHGKVVGKVS